MLEFSRWHIAEGRKEANGGGGKVNHEDDAARGINSGVASDVGALARGLGATRRGDADYEDTAGASHMKASAKKVGGVLLGPPTIAAKAAACLSTTARNQPA